MLPIPLADKVAQLLDTTDILPTERAILKMTASLILYNRLGYTGIKAVKDDRIRLTGEEMSWMPGTMEVLDGLAVPKDWETPEILHRVKQEEEQEEALAAQLSSNGYSKQDAFTLLRIRDDLSRGVVFVHPVTDDEMTDETTILDSYREHGTLRFKARF